MNFFPRQNCFLFFCFLFLLCSGFSLFAQQEENLGKKEIEERIEACQKNILLDEATKIKVIASYTKALELIQVKENWLLNFNLFEKNQKDLLAKQMELQKANAEYSNVLTIPEQASFRTLEQLLFKIEEDFLGFQKKLRFLKSEQIEAEGRKNEVQGAILALKKRMQENSEAISGLTASKEIQEVLFANRVLLNRTKEALIQEKEAYEKEQVFLKENQDFFALQEKWYQLNITQLQKNVNLLFELLLALVQKNTQKYQEDKEINEELKAQLINLLQQATAHLNDANQLITKIFRFEQLILEAPEKINILKENLKNLVELPKIEFPSNVSMVAIEAKLSEIESLQNSLKKDIEKIQEDEKQRELRKVELARLRNEVKQKLDKVQEEQSKKALENEPKEIIEVRDTLFLAHLISLKRELLLYQREEFSYEIRAELFQLAQNKIEQNLSQNEVQIKQVKGILAERKRLEADHFSQLNTEKVQEAIKKIEGIKDLEENLKKDILNFYNQGLEELRKAEILIAESAKFDNARQEAAGLLEQIRAEKPLVFTKPELSETVTLSQLEQVLNSAKSEFTEAKNKFKELENEEKRRIERRIKIPNEILSAKQKLEEISKQLNSPVDNSKGQEFLNASRTLLFVRKKTIELEIINYEKEILSYDARVELLPVRKEQAARKVSYLDKMVKAQEELLNQQRRLETEKAVQQARDMLKATVNAHPIVRLVAEENQVIAKQRAALSPKRITDELARVQKILENFTKNSEWVQEKIETAGLTHSLGLLLRTEKEGFLNLKQYRKNNQAREDEITNIRIQILELRKKKDLLFPDIETRKFELLKKLDSSIPIEQKDAIKIEIENYLKNQAEFIEPALKDYEGYLVNLVEIDLKEKALIRKAEKYSAFIDEKILWIRSSSIFRSSDLRKCISALYWVIDAKEWRLISQQFKLGVQNHPFLHLIVLALFIGCIFLRKKWASSLRTIGSQTNTFQENAISSLVLTFKAFLLTGLLSFVFPFFLYVIGVRFYSFSEEAVLGRAIGVGLKQVSFYYFAFSLMLNFCRSKGLGEAHFRENLKKLKSLRRELLWFSLWMLPLTFLISLFEWQSNDNFRQSFGRLLFLMEMVLLGGFFLRVFSPSSPLLVDFWNRNQKKWFFSIRYFWRFILLLIPLGLGSLAVYGYYYTALQLGKSTKVTIGFLLTLYVIYLTIIRWFSLARLQIFLKMFQAKKEEQKVGTATQISPEESQGMQETSTKTEKISNKEILFLKENQVKTTPIASTLDISAINKQTQQLAKTFLVLSLLIGLWIIWQDIFPAFAFLKKIVLIYETTAEGIKQPYLTLADLCFAIITIFLTTMGSKNIPGFLEITLLQRLPLQAGNRYAFTAITQYGILALGIGITCFFLGVQWAKIQWLVAALSVGLGFGLQEIVANFVSGIILFFEQPIRVGDVVTIGTTSGTVTRIQIRATTIIDWDRKELVVPNKEFITGSLVNWSLTDKVLRVVIPIGVSYDSDPPAVKQLLLKIVDEHSNILKEPKPTAILMDFGENSLLFYLRFFVPSADDLIWIRDEITTRIVKEFRLANIKIAFPQRDLHIHSSDLPLNFPSQSEKKAEAELLEEIEAEKGKTEEDLLKKEHVEEIKEKPKRKNKHR